MNIFLIILLLLFHTPPMVSAAQQLKLFQPAANSSSPKTSVTKMDMTAVYNLLLYPSTSTDPGVTPDPNETINQEDVITGDIYYVEQDNGTTGTGTLADPWNGWNEVSDMQPGDVLRVVGKMTEPLIPSKLDMQGAKGEHIRIEGYTVNSIPGSIEVNGSSDFAVDLTDFHYLTLKNLTITGGISSEVGTFWSHDITLEKITFPPSSTAKGINLFVRDDDIYNIKVINCKFNGHNPDSTGAIRAYIDPSRMGLLHHCEFRNNSIDGDYYYGIILSQGGGGSSNFYLNKSPFGIKIDDNRIANTRHAAIHIGSGLTSNGGKSTIAGNYCINIGDGSGPLVNGLQLHTLRNVLVAYNTVKNVRKGDADGHGIILDWKLKSTEYGCNGNLILGNIIDGTEAGGVSLMAGEYNTFVGNVSTNNTMGFTVIGHAGDGNVFMNNTITNNVKYGIRLHAGAPRVIIRNNIIQNNQIGINADGASQDLSYPPAETPVEEHNYFFNNSGTDIRINNVKDVPISQKSFDDLDGDPKVRSDFKLAIGSPALGAGYSYYNAIDRIDIWGHIFNDTENIGAYFGRGE